MDGIIDIMDYLSHHKRLPLVDQSVLSSQIGNTGPHPHHSSPLSLSEGSSEEATLPRLPRRQQAPQWKGTTMKIVGKERCGCAGPSSPGCSPPPPHPHLPPPALLLNCLSGSLFAALAQFWFQSAVYHLHHHSGHLWCLHPHPRHQKASLCGRCLPARKHDWMWSEEGAGQIQQSELQIWARIQPEKINRWWKSLFVFHNF